MRFEAVTRILGKRQPFDHLAEADVRRLVALSSLGMGGIGSVLLLGVIFLLGFVDDSVVATAIGCAGILTIPLLMRAGLAVRRAAWLFIAIMLAVCLYVSLDPTEGVTAGLLMYLSVLLLFTGAALGTRALLLVGAISLAGIVGLTLYDLSRLDLIARHDTHVAVIIAGTKQAGAVLISIALVLGGLVVFRRAMDEAREARDAARRASASKSAFLANTSHEIRTPLNGVLGMAQVLEATDLTPDQRRYLETITESGHTLLAMLNDVLDLSKVEAGQLAVVASPTDIRALLSTTVAAWRPAAERKGLALALQIAADLPKSVEIDRIRVRQCVENLISNAVKFTDAGSLRISAQGRGAGAEHELRIDVEDTGPGIPAEETSMIFEPFQQIDRPDKRSVGGTGLGLAIVRNLARLMGGDLTVVSEVGVGSTFTLTFRAATAEASAATPVSPARPGSVLLVDTNAESRSAARTMLEQSGRSVTEAATLSDALASGAEVDFDAVMIELDTPGIENASFINRLRRNMSGGERGVVFIGDERGEATLCDSLDLANCIFIRKPVGKAALTAAAEAIEAAGAAPRNGGPAPAPLPGETPAGLLSAARPN